jgi:hypothetical protein
MPPLAFEYENLAEQSQTEREGNHGPSKMQANSIAFFGLDALPSTRRAESLQTERGHVR